MINYDLIKSYFPSYPIGYISDSYKKAHARMLPPNTGNTYSYIEARGGGESVTFFGLQYILHRYFEGSKITKEQVDLLEEDCIKHFGSKTIFDRTPWDIIVNEYNGCFPLEIKAVKEGTNVGTSQVLITIETTDHRLKGLDRYVEDLLMQIWYPISVATASRNIHQVIYNGLVKSGTPESLPHRLVDFGKRGVSGMEEAGIGGLSHEVYSKATDNWMSILFARAFYSCDMPAFSVPASEHGVTSPWLKDNEKACYENLLKEFPTGYLSVVSDTWDVYNAVDNIFGKELKDKILERDGVLVIRPDSGDPEVLLPWILQSLDHNFGSTVNEKGYKVLHDKVRVIQGDNVKIETIQLYCDAVMNAGFSLDNLVWGSGGGLLRNVNRDTFKFAQKASATQQKGDWVGCKKDPVTDSGKKSKEGRLALIENPTSKKLETIDIRGMRKDEVNLLETVFLNGQVLRHQTLDEIREIASSFWSN